MGYHQKLNDIIQKNEGLILIKYIKRHNMPFKTTLSILYDAYFEDYISYKKGNQMIQKIIDDGNRIPVTHFQQVLDWFENGQGRRLY
jgi:predicted nucleic acid-binding protein